MDRITYLAKCLKSLFVGIKECFCSLSCCIGCSLRVCFFAAINAPKANVGVGTGTVQFVLRLRACMQTIPNITISLWHSPHTAANAEGQIQCFRSNDAGTPGSRQRREGAQPLPASCAATWRSRGATRRHGRSRDTASAFNGTECCCRIQHSVQHRRCSTAANQRRATATVPAASGSQGGQVPQQ